MSASRITVHEPFVFTVICPKNEPVTIEFFAVPQTCAEHIGPIRIDWGDGLLSTPDVTMPQTAVGQMLAGDEVTACVSCSHRYVDDGKRTVSITTPSGFLPLKALPARTVSVSSALPTLTAGETDPEGRPEASDTLPPLFPINPVTGTADLNFICPDFLAHNPGLLFFDEAFRGTSLRSVPVSLFSPCKALKSLVRTFADSKLTAIPYGLLRHALTLSLCEETFAHCEWLEEVDNPFGDKKNLPVCLEGFLSGAAPHLFAWCDKSRREEAGWIRPQANLTDPSFDFDWRTPFDAAAPIVSFFAIDLELKGDLLIDWGDGKVERVDWNTAGVLSHAYAAPGTYRVRLHYTAGESVRPFALGAGLTAIHTPLPALHPRALDNLGDFCGWAADRRELTTLPENFFANNPDITDLTQAFAGCVKLESVPDAILEPVTGLKNADAMFAFCKSLKALPDSYRAAHHDPQYDCFAPERDAESGKKAKEEA